MKKNKNTLIVILAMILVFIAGVFFPKDYFNKNIVSLFSGNKQSKSLDSSFRKLTSQDKIKILREIGKSEGSAAVSEVLHRIYPDEPADDHELAHIIGEAGFIERGYDGFDICNSFMRFACYHGVILEAIKQNGYTEEVLQELGMGCKNLERNRTTITACIHGIGHGLMVVDSYDLLKSYKDCDKVFTDPQELFFCYDGASMENVVRRQEAADSKDFLKSKDPFYPCNIVDEKYQPACVREHTHYVRRFVYGLETVKTQSYCLYFKNEQSRTECFGAIGGALNQDYFSDPDKVISECDKLMSRYKENCFGVAAAQYSFGHQFDYAAKVCNALDEEKQRMSCMGSVQSAKASLD